MEEKTRGQAAGSRRLEKTTPKRLVAEQGDDWHAGILRSVAVPARLAPGLDTTPDDGPSVSPSATGLAADRRRFADAEERRCGADLLVRSEQQDEVFRHQRHLRAGVEDHLPVAAMDGED